MIAQDFLLFLCGMFMGALLALFCSWLYFRRRSIELALINDNMKSAFSAISKETLMANVDLMNSSFKASLEQMYKASEQDRAVNSEQLSGVISPLKETLQAVDKKVQELESVRQGAYSSLTAQIEALMQSQQALHKETGDLSRALNAPSVRGRWGEMQLRRVVELSGLSAHCDFVEQGSIRGEDELIRPDMIVTLPNEKFIVVDAKVPLEIFGFDTANDKGKGVQLSQSLRRHVTTLKKKDYFKAVSGSPEFTVMFLPGEAFLHRALAADAALLEYAAQNDVMVVTPITLVALLKAISFGFKQEAVASNVEETRRLAQQLVDRVHKVSEHFEKLGRHLSQASQCYNQTLSSLDSRVLVTARKLAEIKAVETVPESCSGNTLAFIDIMPRSVSAPSDAGDPAP